MLAYFLFHQTGDLSQKGNNWKTNENTFFYFCCSFQALWYVLLCSDLQEWVSLVSGMQQLVLYLNVSALYLSGLFWPHKDTGCQRWTTHLLEWFCLFLDSVLFTTLCFSDGCADVQLSNARKGRIKNYCYQRNKMVTLEVRKILFLVLE